MMAMPAIMAILMLCTGSVCQMAEGYPMVFDTESACLQHLTDVAATVAESADPEATVAMTCAFDFRAIPGTLPGLTD